MLRQVLLLATLWPSVSDAGDLERGRQLFALHCATCHGTDAKGGGPMARALTKAPPDLTNLARAHGGIFPTLQVVSQIDARRPLEAHGGDMPVFGWFFEGKPASVPLGTSDAIVTTKPIAQIILWLTSRQGR